MWIASEYDHPTGQQWHAVYHEQVEARACAVEVAERLRAEGYNVLPPSSDHYYTCWSAFAADGSLPRTVTCQYVAASTARAALAMLATGINVLGELVTIEAAYA